MQEYRAKHPDKIQAYNRKQYVQNAEVRKVYQREYARTHQPRIRTRRLGLYEAKRAVVLDAKAQPCMDCGQTFPSCAMDFDHRPGTDKKFTIARAVKAPYSVDAVKNEIKKCDVVCACCHRIRTENRGYHGVSKC